MHWQTEEMSTDQIQECICEMRCFVRGGVPGIEKLRKVINNIFLHYDIFFHEDKRLIISRIGAGHVVQKTLLEISCQRTDL